MFKKLFVFVLTLALCAGAFTLPMLAASDDTFSAKTYFYDQLSDKARKIYDVLASDENTNAIQTGEAIVIDSFSLEIPNNVSQSRFDSLVDRLTEKKELMADMMPYAADAVAALNRDRPDIFWTNGLRARVNYIINGELQTGSISISPGNRYSVQFSISLPLVEDWDGDGEYDRDLLQDRQLLHDAVTAIAQQARVQSSTRYEQLKYVNDLLCQVNEYHTEAASSNDFKAFYPWTALSALYPLDTENDEAEGSLKPVCEGYARAMKLVCDELDIPCILVSGQGNGENHMWNYVQMEDGLFYALDLTWNDTASTDRYFLKGNLSFGQNHHPTGVFIQNEQTITFTYPALSSRDYVVPTTAVEILISQIPELTEGYDAVEPVTVTLLNYGTRAATLQSISLSDDLAMTLDGTLPSVALAAGEEDTSIRLLIKEDLPAGVYEVTLILVYGNGQTATQTVTLTVKEKPSEPVPSEPDPGEPDPNEPEVNEPETNEQNPPSDSVNDSTKNEEATPAPSPSEQTASKPSQNVDNQEDDADAIRIGCRGQVSSAVFLLLLLIPASFVVKKKKNG